MSSKGNTMADLLSAEFVDGEVLQFEGRGGKRFDYIEDETVMDRLDEVLGVGAWSVAVEPISVADGIVKVTLSGTTPEGAAFSFEDFGYQTRDGGEALKEAVSDGIRRCGRYLGVGRYLYRKHATPYAAPQNAPQRPAGPPPAVRPPVVAANPYAVAADDEPPFPSDLVAQAHPPVLSDKTCSEHGVDWAGKPGDLWHKTPDGRYCRHPMNERKPAAARR